MFCLLFYFWDHFIILLYNFVCLFESLNGFVISDQLYDNDFFFVNFFFHEFIYWTVQEEYQHWTDQNNSMHSSIKYIYEKEKHLLWYPTITSMSIFVQHRKYIYTVHAFISFPSIFLFCSIYPCSISHISTWYEKPYYTLKKIFLCTAIHVLNV